MTTTRPPAPLTAGALVFGYGRDSGGAEQERSVADQHAAVRVACAQAGYQLIRWYADEAKVGSDAENRPAFQELIAACRQDPPPVAALLVWDLARISRAQLDRQFYISDLRRRGVQIVSLKADENVASDNPIGAVIESVLAFTDEEYLRNLSRNVKRGLHAIALTGRMHGRCAPVGYTSISKQMGLHRDGRPRLVQQWQRDPITAPLVQEAFTLYAAGAGMKEIHAKLHLAGTFNSYRYIFKNELYIGLVEHCGATYNDETLRIVDDATWAAVQARRASRIPPRTVTSTYLLSGLLRCGKCAGRTPMYGRSPDPHHQYYVCGSKSRLDAACGTSTRTDLLDTAVMSAVTARLVEPVAMAQLIADLQARANADPTPRQAAAIREAITRNERSISGLLDIAEAGTIAVPEIKRRLAEREAEIKSLQAQLAALPPFRAQTWNLATVTEALARIAAGLSAADILVQRRALRALVARVIYTPPDSIQIEYRDAVGTV